MVDNNLIVSRDIFIPNPIDSVWHFLMSEEKMKGWLNADKFVIDMSDGGEIEFPLSFGKEEYIILGEFSILLLEKKYAFIWREQDKFGESWFNCTTLSFNLERKDNGTLLKLIHDGFKYLPSDIQEGIYERYVDFWNKSGILEKLSSLIVISQ